METLCNPGMKAEVKSSKPRLTITVELSDDRVRATDEEGAVREGPAVALIEFWPGTEQRDQLLAVGQKALSMAAAGDDTTALGRDGLPSHPLPTAEQV